MATTRSTEIEHKYTVEGDVALPSLAEAFPRVRLEQEALLEAVYFDTADRALLGARIALRRRTGGHDAGWHAKLPGAAGRTEVHAPLGMDDALPEGIERVLRSRLRGRPIEPIATIRTVRRATVVGDEADDLVEVVDDTVTATDVAAGTVRAWREWEAEQLGADARAAAALDRVDSLLRSAGARRSPSPAKLAQALGLGRARTPRRPRTAGETLTAVLQPHAEALHRGVQDLVLDPEDKDGELVHDLRKALRRMRGLLALSAVAGPTGTELRERLRILGDGLGEARDPLVAADIAERLLAHDRPHAADVAERWAVLGPRAEARRGTDREIDALGGQEAVDAFAALDRYLATGPDGRDAGAAPARLRRLAKRSLRRAAAHATPALRKDASLDDLHAARKAARRARFVVEAVVEAGLAGSGSRLARAGERATAAQEALGAHRDSALLAERTASLSVLAAAAGEDTYALGVLGERAAQEAAASLATGRRRLRRLVRAARG